MNEEIISRWRGSAGLVFWGVMILTFFGWFAGAMEWIYSGLSAALEFLISYLPYLDRDPSDIQNFKDNLEGVMRVFEIGTVIGWIMYVVGLARFRHAQLTGEALWATSGLYTACWLGLISMLLTFLASCMPWGTAWLLSFPAWVLLIVSYSKFASRFGYLRYEASWSERAQRGADRLRRSARYNIFLLCYPIICVMVMAVVAFALFSAMQNGGSAKDWVASLGVLGCVAVFLGLIALVISVIQFVLRLLGWYDIFDGVPETVVTGEAIAEAGDVVVYKEDEVSDNSNRKLWWWIGGGIVLLLIIWLCASRGSSNEVSADSEDEENIELVTEEFIEEDAPDETVYVGKIGGKYSIEMELLHNDDYYFGSYYYLSNKGKTPIQLSGYLQDDILCLTERVDGKPTGHFEGTFDGTTYEGTWSSALDARELSFNVKLK